MRTRHMHARTSYAYCVNEPFEEIKFHGLGCQESLSDKSNVVVEGVWPTHVKTIRTKRRRSNVVAVAVENKNAGDVITCKKTAGHTGQS